MTRLMVTMVALAALVVAAGLAIAQQATPKGSDRPGDLSQAKRRSGTVLYKVKADLTAEQRKSLEEVRREFGLKNVRKLVKGRVERDETKAAVGEEALCAQLLATGAVEFAEPDYLIPPALTPNDTYYPSMWHHPMINSPWAWDVSTGTSTVLAAVCDTGIQTDHPDLAANLDLAHGTNVADGSGNFTDSYGHGTMCTGLLGAIGNNSIGVAGMAWHVKILPVRITNEPDGGAYTSDIVEGVYYAADQGARVVSLSYSPGNSYYYGMEEAALYLRDHGGLLFVAAGNQGSYADWYDLPSRISVGATDETDQKASYSSWGPYIDLVAPGSNTWTTKMGSTYGTPTGTSNATPIAAGLAALIFSVNPSFTPAQVENIIFSTCVDLGDPGEDDFYGRGRINAVAALAAADPTHQFPPFPNAGPDQDVMITDTSGSTTVTLDGSASTDYNGSITSYVWKEGTSQIATGSTASISRTPGTYSITLTITDNQSNTASDTMVVTVHAYIGPTWLSYTGADLSAGTGTMTIKCSDAVTGELWSLDLSRNTVNYIAQVVKFDDLKDGGSYNYAESYAYGYGLFIGHWKPQAGGDLVWTGTFEELHKDSDYYSYRMTLVRSSSGVEQLRVVTTYTINPSNLTRTRFTAVAVATNTSGQNQTSSSWKSGVFNAYMALNADPYNYSQGGVLSSYQGSSPAYSKHLQTTGGADAIWKITDNLNSANPERQSGQPAWGQAEVMNNAATQGQNLTAGRTFKLTTNLNNNSTVSDNFSLGLSTGGGLPLMCRVLPYDWGYPSTWAAGASYTKNFTLDINITGSGGNYPPVADAGQDQNVTDTDDNGSQAVTLDGSASSDSDGSITSYVWKEGTTQLATGSTASVSLAVGTHTITLIVTDDDGATGYDTVVVTVNPHPGNQPPVANAGNDQNVTDTDESGSETVTLNASASSDSDGTITSYVWKEGTTQIATGSTASVSLAVGTHTITLTVTDNDGATATDAVVVTVNPVSSETTLNPEADSEVRSGSYDDDNYGTSSTLYVREQSGGGTCNRAVFRFDLSSISGTVSDAKLRLYVNTAPASNVTHRLYFMSNDSWVESTITWNNCPSTTSTLTTWSVTTSDANTWKEIDVTDLVEQELAGNDKLSVLVMADTVVNELPLYRSRDYSETTYDPQLVVTTGGGNTPPTANAGSDQVVHDTDRNGSETVTLNGSASSDSDGTIVSYVWKEGTTQLATGSTASVNLAAGVHTITLVVTDDDSATASDTMQAEVNSPPLAEAGSDQTVTDSDASGSETVTLNGSGSGDSDGTITSYVWKEGTTQLATGSTASVNLATGVHSITLTVTDNDSATASDSVSIDVNTKPVANAGNDQNVTDSDSNGSETVTLNGSASSDSDGTITSYVWKEGTTQLATGSTSQVSLAAGVHNITLTVTDNDGATASDAVQVEVNTKPVADAGSDQTVTDSDASGSETVTLDGSASSDSDGTITSYVWMEGTTQLATGPTTQVSLAVGTHVVTLVVTDNDGATDSDALQVEVSPAPAGGDISGWTVAATHGAAGEIAVPAADNYTESRAAGIVKVLITFSAALDPATVNLASVSIVGQVGGDQSGRLDSVSLQDGDTVMVVQLSSALPDGDKYGFTVSDSVKFADGGSINNSRARQLWALAGDVDASGLVAAGDVLAIRGHAGEALTTANARYDLDCSGAISGADLLTARSNLSHALP